MPRAWGIRPSWCGISHISKTLEFPPKIFHSLGGIEYFINLENLVCAPENFPQTGRGALEWLDVSRNKKLKSLDCSNNSLHNVDVSRNNKLSSLVCSNNLLTSLDISHNPLLDVVACGKNSLARLDLRQCQTEDYLIVNCAGNLPDMRIVMGWKQAPVLSCDPGAAQVVENDRKLAFADASVLSQVLEKGYDRNSDGVLSRHEARYITLCDFVCDEIETFKDLRHTGRSTQCRLKVNDRNACKLRSLESLPDFSRKWTLTVEDLPLTRLDVSEYRMLESLIITGTDLEALDLSRISSTLWKVHCGQCPKLKVIWLKDKAQAAKMSVTCDAHTEIRYKR